MMNVPFFLILGCLAGFSNSDDNATYSMYAKKLEDVCAKTSDIENFKTTCQSSTSSIFPDKTPNPAPAISPEDSMIVKRQNEMLLTALINRGMNNSKVPNVQPKYGFEQLNTIFTIYSKVCPIVPPSFFQSIYHLFSYLHWKTAVDRTEYLPKKFQKWIMKLLNNCTGIAKPLPILTEPCKEIALATKNCSSYLCTTPEYEFRLMRADPLIDVIYKAHELVQAVCFPVFKESYRMFHFMHLTVMDTFTDEIKTRWANQVGDFNYWKRLLGPYFDVHLVNIERCNAGAIAAQKLPYRIPRESLPAQIRLTGARKKF